MKHSQTFTRGSSFSVFANLKTWTAVLMTLALLTRASMHRSIAQESVSRVSGGLIVLYRFDTRDGNTIRDQSGFGEPLDLEIAKGSSVRRVGGGLQIFGKAGIASRGAATKITTALHGSNELTLEAWLEPANTSQSGPARIATISADSSNRNLTLGQDKRKYDVRLRTTTTSSNGLPSLASKNGSSQKGKLQHVVYCRDRSGKVSLFVDGRQVGQGRIAGSLRNWNQEYKLLLADEATGERVWQGLIRLVAIYARSLNSAEVRRNFKAGPNAESGTPAVQASQRQDLFATQVAPILASHCIECHDALNRKGGLDLSHRNVAFKADSGAVVVPGKSLASPLIDAILSDDMPLNRPALSAEDKRVLVKWVDEGARWTVDFVDPVLYTHRNATDSFIQRLTVKEYIETVRMTFGIDIDQAARNQLPVDVRADGFNNTAYNLQVDLKHVDCYAKLAEQIVSQLDVREFVRRFSRKSKFTDKDMGEVIARVGAWVLRGPLDEDEVIAYRGISTSVASAGGTWEQAVSLILEAMLQSPRFLYRIERQVGYGGTRPVSEYELANRMSYILWGSSPDRALYDAAADGDLFDLERVASHTDRMLNNPLADERALEFARQWLNLDGLRSLEPDAVRFPNWDPQLAGDMEQETLAYFRYVALDQDLPFSALLDHPTTFVTQRLANHYGLEFPTELNVGPSSDNVSTLVQVDLTRDPTRGGILTQGSVLTIGGDNASMVTRGLFVLHDLLRGVIKDPPPCVDTTPVPSEPGLTQRMIANKRISNDACGGCHGKFEPLAFGFEKFDGLGTFRSNDEFGNTLREDGSLYVPGQGSPTNYASTKELTQMLAHSQRVQRSLTWKLTQFALGRPLSSADAPQVDQIFTQAQANGGSYRSLMKAIILSDLVQLAKTEPSPPAVE